MFDSTTPTIEFLLKLGSEEHHTEWDKPDSKKSRVVYFLSWVEAREKKEKRFMKIEERPV